MIEHSLNEWSESLGIDGKTLRSALSKAGVDYTPRVNLTALQIKTAILGDEKAEKVRNLKLDADLKQIEKDKLHEQLYEPDVVQAEVARAFGMVRTAILQGMAELPPRCNPIDHATARKAIEAWASRFFPETREQINDKP